MKPLQPRLLGLLALLSWGALAQTGATPALPAAAAEAINTFYRLHLNPYLNFHRPCGFAQVLTDARGRRRRRYPLADYATPFEKLRSLPGFEQYLRPGITAADLEAIAARHSDIQAAAQMQAAKAKLFAAIRA